MPVRLGVPKGVGGLAEVVRSPSFATGVGLVQYGVHQQPRARAAAAPRSARVVFGAFAPGTLDSFLDWREKRAPKNLAQRPIACDPAGDSGRDSYDASRIRRTDSGAEDQGGRRGRGRRQRRQHHDRGGIQGVDFVAANTDCQVLGDQPGAHQDSDRQGASPRALAPAPIPRSAAPPPSRRAQRIGRGPGRRRHGVRHRRAWAAAPARAPRRSSRAWPATWAP